MGSCDEGGGVVWVLFLRFRSEALKPQLGLGGAFEGLWLAQKIFGGQTDRDGDAVSNHDRIVATSPILGCFVALVWSVGS